DLFSLSFTATLDGTRTEVCSGGFRCQLIPSSILLLSPGIAVMPVVVRWSTTYTDVYMHERVSISKKVKENDDVCGKVMVITEYFVKNSLKARIMELKRRNMKNNVLSFYRPCPLRKIRRICVCTSQDIERSPYSKKLSIRLEMLKMIKEEYENLGLLEIDDDLFTYDTQLGMIFNEFNRLSRINDDLFTYEIEVPKPTPFVEQRTSDLTHNDLEDYDWKMSYKECEKIYDEAMIFINKRLIRLIDVYWMRGVDEVVLSNKEVSGLKDKNNDDEHKIIEIFRIETNLFDYKTPLCTRFNAFKYLLKVVTELFTHNIKRTNTYKDYENELNNEVGEAWSKNGVQYEICDHICEPFHFKSGKTKWPTCNSNEDGFCNDGELSGMVRDHIRRPYTKINTTYDPYLDGRNGRAHNDDGNQEKEEQHKEGRCDLFDNPANELSVCKIRRFEMIKYSFRQEEEFVTIEEYEYNDLTRPMKMHVMLTKRSFITWTKDGW
ncbi:hypothetical protein Tco_0713875, partial [Tanacetum coccineum]